MSTRSPQSALERARDEEDSDRDARRAAVMEAVRAFQAGEDPETAFRSLHGTYYRPVQRFFARKGFRPEDCLDLTQETLLRVYTGLKQYRHEARFETWLYTVARNVYRKRLRAGAASKRTGQEVPKEDVPTTEPAMQAPGAQLERVLEDERHRLLREAVRELPEQMRRCLTLRIYRGLPYRDIAVIMKIKPDTVKAHLFQARNKLRERLEGTAAAVPRDAPGEVDHG